MAELREEDLDLGRMILDPNNYRFLDDPEFVSAAEDRFHEETVQKMAYQRLRDDGLLQLKNSILKNGFLPVERIVVQPYPSDASLFVVVEGNRRVAALKWIRNDHDAGITVSSGVMAMLEAVPVIIVEDAEDDPGFIEALMGVRHVSGIKQWGGYQRARLVATLRDERGLDSPDVAERLGLSTQEVNRRYRAFKTLQQMLEDEEYSEHAVPNMYPLFHEAVSQPVVREWLGWDDGATRFTDTDQLEMFYGLVAGYEDDEGNRLDPKITTYVQVRELRHILTNTEAKRVLLDPARSFLDALTISKREELMRAWRSEVSSAIAALSGISVQEVKGLEIEDVETIRNLAEIAKQVLDDYGKLST